MPRPSFLRRPSLPADVRAALPLEHGERVLAWAPLTDGGTAVATERALLLPERGSWRRLPWEHVTSATWDAEQEELLVTALSADGPSSVGLALARQSPLPETVRERVQASIVVSRHVRLQGSSGVRIVGRRVSGSDELAWQAVLDRGLDPQDPVIVAAAEAALDELRRETSP